VCGCLEWQRDGLNTPAVVTSATGEYREESDPLREFVADRCVIAANASCTGTVLRRAYVAYCGNEGVRPVGSRTFSDCLRRAGAIPVRSHAGRFWRGIGLMDGVCPGGP